MSFKKAILSVSVFASLALATDENVGASRNTLKNNKEIEYEKLCKSVAYMLKMASFQICEIRTIKPTDTQILQEFLSLIRSSKQVANQRIETMQLDADKEVLYSLVATEHIIEAILDKDFFEITGGYRMPSDFISFGKEILSAT